MSKNNDSPIKESIKLLQRHSYPFDELPIDQQKFLLEMCSWLESLETSSRTYVYTGGPPSNIDFIVFHCELDFDPTRYFAFLDRIPAIFPRLKGLEIVHNSLPELPASIGTLSHLTRLYIHMEALTTLPHSFLNLTNIEQLDIRSNGLTSLPPNLFAHMPRLNHLTLLETKLPEFDSSFYTLIHLQYLRLNNTPPLPFSMDRFLTAFPLDIIESYSTLGEHPLILCLQGTTDRGPELDLNLSSMISWLKFDSTDYNEDSELFLLNHISYEQFLELEPYLPLNSPLRYDLLEIFAYRTRSGYSVYL